MSKKSRHKSCEHYSEQFWSNADMNTYPYCGLKKDFIGTFGFFDSLGKIKESESHVCPKGNSQADRDISSSR